MGVQAIQISKVRRQSSIASSSGRSPGCMVLQNVGRAPVAGWLHAPANRAAGSVCKNLVTRLNGRASGRHDIAVSSASLPDQLSGGELNVTFRSCVFGQLR
jgi:hypothetical protein